VDCSQGAHEHFLTHPEVLGIHVQLVTVQLAQLSKGALEVVHVLNSLSEGSQHLFAMGLDLGVAHYGRGRGQVAEVVKEPLGPGCLPAQGLASSLFHIHFAPQASDSSLLLRTKMHHDVRSGSLQALRERSRCVLLQEAVPFYPLLLTFWALVPPSSLKSLVRLSCVPQGWSQVRKGSAMKNVH
uniref:Uncharacterized protein n=1 Tax=Ursus americanus TaxID=9643 RepID=A0A452Q9H7_URSAM